MLIYKKRKKTKWYIFTMQQWQAYLKTKQINASDIFNILDVIFWGLQESYGLQVMIQKIMNAIFFWSG